MNNKTEYIASCFCGDVKLSLRGEPEAMAYCHCDSCRRWSAGQVNAFTLWKPENISITSGRDKIAGFNGNPGSEHDSEVSHRKWCKTCGGHIFTEHPDMGVTDVPAVVISGLMFKPGFHVHYQESVHHIVDGLPKFRDLPKEAGGSGQEMRE
ncbi:MAG: GFA family protein [Gammaproteobacteria bacterium]|nr:GFA family protein [Gammaproteobacteria bacterium]